MTYGERRDKASWVDSCKYPRGEEIGMSTAFRRATAEPTVSAYELFTVIVNAPNQVKMEHGITQISISCLVPLNTVYLY